MLIKFYATRVALASAITTSGAGYATWKDLLPDLLPDVLGMVATGFGIILTGILIVKHGWDMIERSRKNKKAIQRKLEGRPCNRKEDNNA